MYGIYGSAALGILAAPVTGYSLALGFIGSGSLGVKRLKNARKSKKLKKELTNLTKVQERLNQIVDIMR